jgi:serine/threonine protein kinase
MTIANRYQILAEIGEGGFAIVYRAQDQQLQREVALKFLKFQQSGEQLTRFQREAKFLAQLSHENIISVYSFDLLDETQPYIVMEFLHGKSLRKMIGEQSTIESKQMIGLLEQICHALTYAHAAGIVHRDLNPGNIFVLEEEQKQVVKILDFGLSRLCLSESEQEKLTQTGILMGSPPYMSPEQAAGLSSLDKRSDIYSLGCILYECLTGRTPLLCDNPMGMIYLQRSTMPEEPEFECEDKNRKNLLTQIMLCCLQKEAEKRFQDCSEILDSLSSANMHTKGLSVWTRHAPKPKARNYTLPVISLLLLFAIVSLVHFSNKQKTASKNFEIINKPKSSAPHPAQITPLSKLMVLSNRISNARAFILAPSSELKQMRDELSDLIPRLEGDAGEVFAAFLLKASVEHRLHLWDEEKVSLNKAKSFCYEGSKTYKEACVCLRLLAENAISRADYGAAERYANECLTLFYRVNNEVELPSIGLSPSIKACNFDNLEDNVRLLRSKAAFFKHDYKLALETAQDLLAFCNATQINPRDVRVHLADIYWATNQKEKAFEQVSKLLERSKAFENKSTLVSPSKPMIVDYYNSNPSLTGHISGCMAASDWYAKHGELKLAKEAINAAETLCRTYPSGARATIMREIHDTQANLDKASRNAVSTVGSTDSESERLH